MVRHACGARSPAGAYYGVCSSKHMPQPGAEVASYLKETGRTGNQLESCIMFKAMIIAGFGGFIGTCLRFLTGKFANYLCASAFPWGTFAVNIIGSFIIGIFFGMAEKTHLISPSMNVFLITGFCGGFTTFSSFADDMYLLLKGSHWLYFILYVVLSFALGLLLVWLGRSLIKAS